MKVSQSLIKDWNEYVNGEVCGSVIESKYVKNTWDRTADDSDSKALGRYFEYLLTGEIPTGYNTKPEPVWMKSAKPADMEGEFPNVDKMLAPYRLAHINADRIKKLLKDSGITITKAQVKLTKGIYTGTIDIEADYKPKGKRKATKINLDVKYSGLIHDKWNKFGWRWTDEQKEYNAIQSAHYTLLNGRPTWFLVVSSTNEKDVELFAPEISDFYMEQHEKKAERIIENVEMINELGWNNYPSLQKCQDCPLKDVCKDAVKTLIPEKIEIEL